MTGGELFDKIVENGISEDEAVGVVTQLMQVNQLEVEC